LGAKKFRDEKPDREIEQDIAQRDEENRHRRSEPGRCAAARVLARARALLGCKSLVAAMGIETGLFIATMHFS
ncbi:MAG: hypothetical protein ACREDG_08395, partial [Methylocella sp.]